MIGFAAGLIAKAITPGVGPGGFIPTTLLGADGSLKDSCLNRFLGGYKPGQSADFSVAVVDASVRTLGYPSAAKK